VLRSFVLNVLRSGCLVFIIGKSQVNAYKRLGQVDDIVGPSSQTVVVLVGKYSDATRAWVSTLCERQCHNFRAEARLDTYGPLIFKETGFRRNGPRAAGIDRA
jgi:hypothetical protein